PGVLAKMATTIDHLSGGRLEFGLGASGAEVEHAMLGLPFPEAGERIHRLGEALAVCRKLWTEDNVSFAGRYYTLAEATQTPKPLQRPYPRIWVGGAGEHLTLRVVAEHADVWNVIGPIDAVVRKAGILDQHCAKVGRDPTTIKRSVQPRLDPADPVAVTDLLHTYYDAGFTENVVYIPPVENPVRIAEIVADRVLPVFARHRSSSPRTSAPPTAG